MALYQASYAGEIKEDEFMAEHYSILLWKYHFRKPQFIQESRVLWKNSSFPFFVHPVPDDRLEARSVSLLPRDRPERFICFDRFLRVCYFSLRLFRIEWAVD
jgi:hypothetical protein